MRRRSGPSERANRAPPSIKMKSESTKIRTLGIQPNGFGFFVTDSVACIITRIFVRGYWHLRFRDLLFCSFTGQLRHIVQPDRPTNKTYGFVSLEPPETVFWKAKSSGLESQQTDGNPTSSWLVRCKYPEGWKAEAGQIQVQTACICDGYLFDVSLLQGGGQTQQVLAPIQITINQNSFGMLTCELIEIRQIIRMGANRRRHLPG